MKQIALYHWKKHKQALLRCNLQGIFQSVEHINPNFPDRQQVENKEKGYMVGADFKPQTSIEVLYYAAYFEPGYSGILKILAETSDPYPNWQSVLNAARISKND